MVAPASFPEKGEKTDAEEKNAAADESAAADSPDAPKTEE